MSDEPIEVVVVIDGDGNEALYVDGAYKETEGMTVFSCDIAEHTEGRVIRFSHVNVTIEGDAEWPENLSELDQVYSS